MFQIFGTNVREAMLTGLKEGRWLGDEIIAIAETDLLILRLAIEQGYFRSNELEQAIHVGICSAGLRCYQSCIENRGIRPKFPDDHDLRVAFGYAIRHGIITNKQLEKVVFGPDDSAENHIRESEGLLEWAIATIKSGRVIQKFTVPGNSDCCCN